MPCYCWCTPCPVTVGGYSALLLLVHTVPRYCRYVQCPVTVGAHRAPLLLVDIVPCYCWCTQCPVTVGGYSALLLLVHTVPRYCWCTQCSVIVGAHSAPLLSVHTVLRYCWCTQCSVIVGAHSAPLLSVYTVPRYSAHSVHSAPGSTGIAQIQLSGGNGATPPTKSFQSGQTELGTRRHYNARVGRRGTSVNKPGRFRSTFETHKLREVNIITKPSLSLT